MTLTNQIILEIVTLVILYYLITNYLYFSKNKEKALTNIQELYNGVMRGFIIVVILSVVTGFAHAENAASTLTQQLQNIKTFSARFDQTITSNKGKVLSHCVGVLNIQKPGRFSWETVKPNALRVVADGQNIWTYDIDLEQITKQNAKTTMVGSPAALLAGQTVRLEKDFIVKYSDDSHENYTLYPRVNDSMFNEIKIKFKNKQLLSMDMKDGLGQHIKTQFTDVKLNTRIDPKIFIFNAPKGIDIIHNQKI